MVIYDKRLLTKNYGQRLLNALPIFPIEQPEVPEVKTPGNTDRRAQEKHPC